MATAFEQAKITKTAYLPLMDALTILTMGKVHSKDELITWLTGKRDDRLPLDEELELFFADDTISKADAGDEGSDEQGDADVPDDCMINGERLGKLTHLWEKIRDAAIKGNLELAGRYVKGYLGSKAKLKDWSVLGKQEVQTYAMLDLSRGGLQRLIDDNSPFIMWDDHPQAFDVEFARRAEEDDDAVSGFMLLEVDRKGFEDLKRSLDLTGRPAANRRLDHDDICKQAETLKEVSPGITIGSAALSIEASWADGRAPHVRTIEKIIAPLWCDGE